MTNLLSRIAGRLRDERGMALVMAIGISFVLAILGASVILFTTSNERHANRVNATERAYAIAQAGIDNAASQIGNLGTKQRHIATNYICRQGAVTAANCSASIDGGTVSWSGQLLDLNDSVGLFPEYRWRITSISTLANPSSPGGTITRTLTADVPLVPRVDQDPNSDAWHYIYSRANDGDPNTCDQTILNNPGITSSFYVNGDLCLDNSSNVYGPADRDNDPPVNVVVKGRAYLNHPSTSLGTSARPLSYIEADAGCKYKSQPVTAPPARCSDFDKVWPQSVYNGLADTPCGPPDAAACPVITAPTADFTSWYHAASPGPAHTCGAGSFGPVPMFENEAYAKTNVPNRSVPAVQDLAPSQPYQCNTRSGYIRWTPGNPGVLSLKGTIFIDGSAEFSSDGLIRYDGFSAIYLSGSYRQRQTVVCAQISGSMCDSNWSNGTTNVLAIVTGGTGSPAQPGSGMSFEQSSGFQGALYSAGNMTFENNTWVQGPMIAEREIIENSMFFHYIPDFIRVPFGLPGVPVVDYDLGPVQHYVGG
jgi:hypothetical protein